MLTNYRNKVGLLFVGYFYYVSVKHSILSMTSPQFVFIVSSLPPYPEHAYHVCKCAHNTSGNLSKSCSPLSACALPRMPICKTCLEHYLIQRGNKLCCQPLPRTDSAPFSFPLLPNDTVALSVSPNGEVLQVHVFTFYWVSWEWCCGGSTWELGLIKILDTYAHFKSLEANQSLIPLFIFSLLMEPLSIWWTQFLNFMSEQTKSQVSLMV